ncbi:MAG: phosphatidylserine decarboxylase family protein [Nitrospinota bacterium]
MKGQFLGLPLAREGVRFIVPVFALSLFSFAMGWNCVGSIFLGLTIFVTAFFRDPDRKILQVDRGVISPADGKVVEIVEVDDDPVYGKTKGIRVSIFLNVFNVHVNRSPVSGKVLKVAYNKGKFINAAHEKASLDNEQNAVLIETPGGKKVLVKQIAGLIARRILCWSKEGDQLASGERFGLIRFGSRTDIFFPEGSEISVQVGDKVKGGLHLIGKTG